MSMPDEVRWDAALPADHPSGANRLFRTSSFGCPCFDHYVVTPEGRLFLAGNGWQDDLEFEDPQRTPVDVGFHGDIRMCSDDGRRSYLARFTHGTLEWIRPLADGEPWEAIAIASMKFRRGTEGTPVAPDCDAVQVIAGIRDDRAGQRKAARPEQNSTPKP